VETVRILVGMHHSPAIQSQEEAMSPRRGAWIETQGLSEGTLLRRALEVQADAIVLNLGGNAEMPISPGGASEPEARTLVLCLHPEIEPLGERAITATACAFFLSTGDDAVVEKTVNSVHARVCRYTRGGALQDPAAVRVPPSRLKEQDLQILRLLAQEKTSKEIAAALEMSPRTVDAHRSKLMKKLGVQSTVGLAAYAIRAGLVGA
jgi:DNA-binding NarL/FixJ family response regulator